VAFFKNLKISSRLLLMVLGTFIGLAAMGLFGLYELRSNLIKDRQVKTRHIVESVHDMLKHYPLMVERGVINQEGAKKFALSDLRRLRYDQHEYFWVTDSQNTLLMHPFRTDLEGKDLSDFEDPKGKKLFVEMEEKALQGGGYVAYSWPQPGSHIPSEKISYVKIFEPWGWIIGTGIYIDDVDQIFWHEARSKAIIGFSILILVLAASIFIARGISKPLSQVTLDMRRLSDGNLDIATKDLETGGEVGELLKAIVTFRTSLLETERLRKEQEISRAREEKMLRENEMRFRTIAETVPLPLAICDFLDGAILFSNSLFHTTFGLGESTGNLNIDQVFDGTDERSKAINLIGRNNVLVDHQMLARRADGTPLWVSLNAQYMTYMDKPAIVFGLLDISKRKEAEETARKLSAAMDQSPASILITDADGVIEYANPKLLAVSGYNADEIIGQKPDILSSGNTPRSKYEDLWRTILDGKTWRGEFHNKRKDGSLFWEHASISPIFSTDGDITHFVSVMEDITERKEYEKRLLRQASYDPLTDLPNRLLAMDRLEQAMARAKRWQWRVALLFIDLDHFKKINDTLGHGIGDKHLKVIAERLKKTIREADTVARLGGDEFLVVVADLSSTDVAENVSEKLLENIARPVETEGHELSTTASIGITLYPDDGEEPSSLLRNADAAMYRAKELGRNTFSYFTPEMNAQALARLAIETHLRHALERNELEVHYQSINDLKTGQIIGAEALLRWSNPELGDIHPETFVPLAEETGLIVSIGDWALETACRDAVEWQNLTGQPILIAVNIAFPQIRNGRLSRAIQRITEKTGLSPEHLMIEITEQTLLQDELDGIQALREISDLGVKISIDDFGTGSSAFTYLKQLPVSSLKIDPAFIQHIARSEEDAALATAIIAMAHSLGLTVIGEGIEDGKQLDVLKSKRCDHAQGFHFETAVPKEAFASLLTDGRPTKNSENP